tara:strand:- start:143 stop:610 length:468 start_codon:yes stop_codon:yes gene_type:complete
MEQIQELSNKLFDIKHKLKDQEYIDLMKTLETFHCKKNKIKHSVYCILSTNIFKPDGDIEEITNFFVIEMHNDHKIDIFNNTFALEESIQLEYELRAATMNSQQLKTINLHYAIHNKLIHDYIDTFDASNDDELIVSPTRLNYSGAYPITTLTTV